MPPWASLPLHLLGISGLLVLATGAGLRISNAESGESPLERSLLACALGLGLLCGIIFLLGIQGLLKPWVLGVLAVALGLWGARPLGGLVRSALQSRQAAPEPWTVFEKTLLLILAAMALSHFLYSYAPPTADDELTYQIALPRLYATAGRFVSTPDNMASFYPLNAQLLYAAVLSVGNALSVKTLLWAFGMLVLAAIWILGRRRLGMSRAAALLAVTLFAVMPYTTSLSGVTSSDFMDVFVELMAFNVLFMAAPASGRRVILAGILGGVGMGTRPYAGAWVVAMAVLLCLRDRRWQEAALFLGVSALVFSPWPLRNGVLTGILFVSRCAGSSMSLNSPGSRSIRSLIDCPDSARFSSSIALSIRTLSFSFFNARRSGRIAAISL